MFAALLTPLLLCAEPTVKPRMHAAAGAVITLQPLLARPDAFRADENAREVRAAIDALSQLRHAFLAPPGQRTSADALTTLFASQAEQARADYDQKRDEAARLRLGTLTSMCLGCHLREPSSTEFRAAAPAIETLELDDLERARLYALTRQFDRALAIWREALVAPPKTDVEAFEQAQALRVALSVAVRGRDDPGAAVALLEQQRGRQVLPGFVRRSVELWLTEAQAWKASRTSVARLTPAAAMQLARQLMAGTQALRVPIADDDHFIALSRAAAALDELLRKEPAGPLRAEALYRLGVISATIDDVPLWQLEGLYLEACVRENAGQLIGKTCLERLRERTWVSYRNRQDVPAEVLSRLNELSAL